MIDGDKTFERINRARIYGWWRLESQKYRYLLEQKQILQDR